MTPFLFYWWVGLVLNMEIQYLAKLGLFTLVWIVCSLTKDFLFDDRMFHVIPLAVYFAVKVAFKPWVITIL